MRKIANHEPVATHFEVGKIDLSDDRPPDTSDRWLTLRIPVASHLFPLSKDVDRLLRLRARETWPPEFMPGRHVMVKMLGGSVDAQILKRVRKEIVLRGRFVA